MDKEKLLEISLDKNLLEKEIQETKGYVLFLMESEKIFPKIDYLVEKINPYSIDFILNNYSLDDEQKKQFRKLLNKDDPRIKINLSEQEIVQYLKNNIELPKDTILSAEILNQYFYEIGNQWNLGSENNIEKILINSIKNITLNNFLHLNKDFLKKNLFLFEENSDFFADEEYRKLFKEVYLSSKSSFDPELLKNFKPTIEDRPFLEILLNKNLKKHGFRNSISFSYEECCSKIPGFDKVFSKMEYFEKYKKDSLKIFNEQEIEEHKEKIQEILFNNCEYDSYAFLDQVVRIDAWDYQIDKIIDKNLIKRIIDQYLNKNKKEYFYLRSIYSDIKENREKENILKTNIIDLLITYPEYQQKIEGLSFREFSYDLLSFNFNNQYIEEKKINLLTKYVNIFLAGQLKNEALSNNSREVIAYFNKYQLENIKQYAKTNCSVNLLWLILNYNKQIDKEYDKFKYTDSEHNKEIILLIKKIANNLNNQESKFLLKLFNFENKENYQDLKQDKFIINKKNNFLDYKNNNFKNLSSDLIYLILHFDKKSENYILENKIQLDDNIILSFLHDGKNLEFLKKYIETNQEKIIKNEGLVNKIRQHKNGGQVFLIRDEQEEENYNKLINYIKNDKKKKKNNKEHENKNFYRLVEQFNAKISYSFYEEKVKKLVKEKNYNELMIILEKNKNLAKYFYNYVNKLNSQQFLHEWKKDIFKQLVINSVDYDGKTEINLNNIEKNSHLLIAETILKDINKTIKYNDDRENNPAKVVALFNDKAFVKEFAIKNFPLTALYSYSYRFNETKYSNKDFIDEPYSNQEIIDLINNVEKTKTIFDSTHVNGHIHDFFAGNFNKREKEYQQLVQWAEKNNLKLYLILFHRQILSSFIERDNNAGLDEQVNKYILKFNIDTICKAMGEVLKEIDKNANNSSQYRKNEAIATINSFIYNTYYDKSDQNYQIKYFSSFNQDQSEKILFFLIKEAPLLLYSYHVIGNIIDTSEYIKNNFYKIYDLYSSEENIVDCLLTPNNNFRNNHYRVDGRYADYLNNIFEGMVNYLVENDKRKEIIRMAFLIKQYKFLNEKSYSYDEINKLTKNNDDIFRLISENNKIVEKLDLYLLKNSIEQEIIIPPKSKKNKI